MTQDTQAHIQTGEDRKVLEAALRVMSKALDGLVDACLDKDGQPMAPSRGDLMRARSMLPAYCMHTLRTKE